MAAFKELVVNVVNANGHLCVYKYALENGKLKKPLKSVHDISVETNDPMTRIQLNMLCCQQLNETDEILVGYGTFLAPKFEKLVSFEKGIEYILFKNNQLSQELEPTESEPNHSHARRSLQA